MFFENNAEVSDLTTYSKISIFCYLFLLMSENSNLSFTGIETYSQSNWHIKARS